MNWADRVSLINHARSEARKQKLKNKCERCGSTKYLVRHHTDYSKPTEVMTLCKSCHKLLHILKGYIDYDTFEASKTFYPDGANKIWTRSLRS